MEIFDTHFHFYGEETPGEFIAKISSDLELCRSKCGVPVEDLQLLSLAAGADYLESLRAMEFAGVVPGAYFSCGVHPHQAADFLQNREDFSCFRESSKLVAIGEIGLDYFYEESPREMQRKVFDEFLTLALDWQLPAMLHLRDHAPRRNAYADALAVLPDFVKAGGRFVIHCCTASPGDVEEFLALGAMIGVTGIVTFRGAADVRAMLGIVPDDRLLIETDSPYLAPAPFRGRENTPGMVALVAEALAEERNCSFEDMVKLTTDNGKRFYNIGN